MKQFSITAIAFFLFTSLSFGQSTKYFRKIIHQPPGQTNWEDGYNIKQLPTGEYLLACNGGNLFTTVRAFTLKLDPYGNVINRHDFGDTSVTSVYLDMKLTPTGAIVGGWYRELNPTEQFRMVIKTDFNGDSIWTRVFPNTTSGSGIYEIIPTFDAGYLIAGYWNGPNGFWDTNVAKLDSMGNLEWDSVYVGPFIDVALGIIQLPDSGYVLCGGEGHVLGAGDGLLLRIDQNGNTVWKKLFNFNGIEASIIDLKITPDNKFIMAGGLGVGFSSHIMLIKTDTSGNMIWMKELTKNNNQLIYGQIAKILILPDGDYVSAGGIYQNPGSNSLSMSLLKTDTAGNLKWIRYYTPNPAYDVYGYDVTATSDGGFIISGRRDTLGKSDIYLIKTNCLGFTGKPRADFTTTWINNTATFYNLSVRADTCIYYFGDGDSAVTLLTDTVPVVHTYSGPGPWNSYLVALACGESDTLAQTLTTGIYDFNDLIEKTFTVYPNPAGNQITVSCRIPQEIKSANLHIYDLGGRLIKSELLINNFNNLNELIIDISSLPSGSFHIVLQPDEMRGIVRKLVVVR